jgi:WD40 repeat protein
VSSVAFSPDGRFIVTGSADETVKLWSIESDDAIQTIENFAHIGCVAFSPDGKILAIVNDDGNVFLCEFDSQKGEITPSFWYEDDDKKKESTYTYLIRYRLDVSPPNEDIISFDRYVRSLCFSPDGKFIAAGNRDHTTTLWNLNDDRPPIILRGHNGWIRSLSFNASGTIIATASDDKTVKLWNLQGQELRTLKGHNDEVHDISFNPDGTIIATASNDKTVKLWNIHGQELQTLAYGDRVDCVSFIPVRGSNTIIIGSRDNRLIVRELSSLNRWVELSNANLENLLEDAKQWIKNYSALDRNSWIETYLEYTPGE